MTKDEANKALAAQYEEMARRTGESPSNADLISLSEAMMKIYILLANAGYFDGDFSNVDISALKN